MQLLLLFLMSELGYVTYLHANKHRCSHKTVQFSIRGVRVVFFFSTEWLVYELSRMPKELVNYLTVIGSAIFLRRVFFRIQKRKGRYLIFI